MNDAIYVPILHVTIHHQKPVLRTYFAHYEKLLGNDGMKLHFIYVCGIIVTLLFTLQRSKVQKQ